MSYTVDEITHYYWTCGTCGEVSEDYESEDAANRFAIEHEGEAHD